MDSILGFDLTRRIAAVATGAIIVAGGSGCRPSVVAERPPVEATSASSFGTTYRIDPEASELHVLVYRAGALARLGHNHVVAARDIMGRFSRGPTLEGSTVELYLPVDRFEVDAARLRERYGDAFASTPTENDIARTTDNMLGASLLDAAAYPQIRIAGSLRQDGEGFSVDADINVKETTLHSTFPIELEVGDDRLIARGAAAIDHGELGLTPFSVMLGALRVAETLEIRFVLTARRETQS